MADEITNNLTGLTVELLSAYVANNNVRSDDLSGLIASTHAALSGLPSSTVVNAVPKEEVHQPAVTARKSLADRQFIVSLIDGKRYKSLKRHLTGHGLTAEAYRERYKLPSSYPMVAPGYSDARREIAKRLGLGRKPSAAEPAAALRSASKPTRKSRPKALKTAQPEVARPTE